MNIRVAVVDDQALVRGGFAMVLDHQDNIKVVAEVEVEAEPVVEPVGVTEPVVEAVGVTEPVVEAVAEPEEPVLEVEDDVDPGSDAEILRASKDRGGKRLSARVAEASVFSRRDRAAPKIKFDSED